MNPLYQNCSFSHVVPSFKNSFQFNQLVQELINLWINDYQRKHIGGDIIETRSGNFSYLFDISSERLISAWGVSNCPIHEKRDSSRMQGHPLGVPYYHRGHVIPHQLGGGTDINLVTQKGSLNVGAFRILERMAVNTPGALYFTHWIYPAGKISANSTQLPTKVNQGLLIPGNAPLITLHNN